MSIKEQVLARLLCAEDALSGEELARQFGVTRNAVWKAIVALREEGYEIEAVTNRGYQLRNADERFGEVAIRKYLNTQSFGQMIETHEEIDSTNTRAKQLAMQGAEHGTLVCARRQTGGRGRFGRHFHSPEDSGIYMSLILRPQLGAERAVMITSMAAVAVARAIERLSDVQAQIKWVNDVYINGRKACGILCEAGLDFESQQLEYAVVGIGVNVAKMEFPEELKSIATSIGNESDVKVSGMRLIAEICNEMEKMYPQLATGTFMQESRARSNVIGRQILVLRGEEQFAAEAVDIDDQGGLIIRTAEGLQTVQSGEISVRWNQP